MKSKIVFLLGLCLFNGTVFGVEAVLSEPPLDAPARVPDQTPNWLETNDAEIQSCLSRRKIPDGVWTKNSGIKTTKCNGKPPQTFQSPYAYSIRTLNGQIEMTVKVELHYPQYNTLSSQWSEAHRRSMALEQCVEEYYKRNGINFRLETLTKTGPKTRAEPGYIPVEMAQGLGNDSLNWNAGLADAIVREGDRKKFVCGGIAHEVGHLLGLGDGYKADDCPNRPVTAEDDIMNGSDFYGHLYPYAIRSFIRPLCAGAPQSASFSQPLAQPSTGRATRQRSQRSSSPYFLNSGFRSPAYF